jgi:hypothetical protein
MRLHAFVLLLLLIAVQSVLRADDGTDACLKRVFGEYCLGGSLQQLLQQRPYGMPAAQQNGDRTAVIYLQGRERTYVMAYQGRIYKVLHTFEPASQVKLKDLRERLVTKYGDYRDRSYYPGYARTQASRIGAIRRGEGELRYAWQSNDASWRIELSWTRKLGISLAYLANELDREQQQAQDSGL